MQCLILPQAETAHGAVCQEWPPGTDEAGQKGGEPDELPTEPR